MAQINLGPENGGVHLRQAINYGVNSPLLIQQINNTFLPVIALHTRVEHRSFEIETL